MKRYIVLFAFFFLVSISFETISLAHEGHLHSTKSNVAVLLSDGEICTHSDIKIDGQVYLKASDIFKCLNYKTNWDNKNKIFFIQEKIKLKLTANSDVLILNEKTTVLPDLSKVINGRLFIATSTIKIMFPKSIFDSTNNILYIFKKDILEDVDLLGKKMVMVKTYDQKGNKLDNGSGVIISPKGFVVTSLHVIQKADKIEVTLSDSSTLTAILVNKNDEYDIAILKVSSTNLDYISLGDSSKIKSGQEIITISAPLGLMNTISTGIISNQNRTIFEKNLIQITAPVYFGSSGGAVINTNGDLIGIITNGVENAANINFAVPVNKIKNLL
ncbi:Copper amine oxidase N-terminal domain-containing protein [Paenibacillus sophorae]|uniref:Copper amine oxidase N-terminal domain-containing protein n=1 Tax=Paenibacillus sophorae TaxID=1333845 RepID=A0A1H8LM52_9BACL|nr:trypsin-like peptidase domain-containing protein [Paenibacillus sophorae]QWU17230.1 trypsin-like peptidase domain-containing protein [Paenibacillus sophorae]SEO06282.1 Copper amine oxidase N-terminal domain-containing protein [Paenibacillus sophorae]